MADYLEYAEMYVIWQPASGEHEILHSFFKVCDDNVVYEIDAVRILSHVLSGSSIALFDHMKRGSRSNAVDSEITRALSSSFGTLTPGTNTLRKLKQNWWM